MRSIYDNFINHLNTCSGCIFPRETVKCRFRGACAIAEVLHKKGIVKNAEDLLTYGIIPIKTKEHDKYYVCDN